jgi:hypothetical protein
MKPLIVLAIALVGAPVGALGYYLADSAYQDAHGPPAYFQSLPGEDWVVEKGNKKIESMAAEGITASDLFRVLKDEAKFDCVSQRPEDVPLLLRERIVKDNVSVTSYKRCSYRLDKLGSNWIVSFFSRDDGSVWKLRTGWTALGKP